MPPELALPGLPHGGLFGPASGLLAIVALLCLASGAALALPDLLFRGSYGVFSRLGVFVCYVGILADLAAMVALFVGF